MKILVTGAGGQLGHDVMNELYARGHEAVGSGTAPQYSGEPDGSPATWLPYVSMDIREKTEVMRTMESLRPDAVIHCAAWTAVDAAEEEENRERVFEVNAGGTEHIAQACRKLDCKMLYISTDYVFDGRGSRPWTPEETDFAPQNVYGQSKLEGERAVKAILKRYFIVRIAWVFGKNGKNFVKTMLSAGEKRDTLRVVNDQIGTPTYTRDLARLLADMVETEQYGIYHATNEGGYISWYEFAREIFRQAGRNTTVIPVPTAEYGERKAKRPENSRLDKSKLVAAGFCPLPDWKDALARYLREIEV